MPERATIFNAMALSWLVAGLNFGWVEPSWWLGMGFLVFAFMKTVLFLLTLFPPTDWRYPSQRRKDDDGR